MGLEFFAPGLLIHLPKWQDKQICLLPCYSISGTSKLLISVCAFGLVLSISAESPDSIGMPARVISVVTGILLIVLCVILFFAIRPLSWNVVGLALGAGGLRGDLLYGGIRRKWPVGALLWLVR